MGKPLCVNRIDSDASWRADPLKRNFPVSGGIEKNIYCLSSGERNGNSPNSILLRVVR